MFLEDEKAKIKEGNKVFGQKETVSDPNSNIFVIIGMILLVFLFFYAVKEIFFSGQNKAPSQTGTQNASSSAVNPGQLPRIPEDNTGDKYDIGTSSEALIAENVGFGYFYEKPTESFFYSGENYELPLNLKTDVNNYYEISRIINLDPQLNDFNRYGFSIIEKQNVFSQKDFFAAYNSLNENGVPIMITGDFLIYNYLNTLKGVYKEIEKNVFYERIWNINKVMYDISLTRYKKTLAELGPVNDPVLEGQRLQLAYFSVALKLLMPENNQIVADANFSDAAKFNLQEADKYGFVLPDFMKIDIEKEVELIREAKLSAKSPVFLYVNDYRDFAVPANYKNNAKLNNYYLAIRWLKSSFPLYHTSEFCPDCLLDRDDWIINLYAASSIARDFSDNQDLKNQWAIVYKFISFFSGLRQELTYLNYHAALKELFGENYAVDDIFSVDNPNRLDDIYRIRNRLAEFDFPAIEGGLDHDDPENRSKIGMRILQEAYWPNNYLLGQLTGNEVVYAGDDIKNAPKTLCANRDKTGFRCSGTGMDIVNLVFPVQERHANDNFRANANYNGYHDKVFTLRSEMDSFNEYTRNNNIYWLTLDILKPLLDYEKTSKPVYFHDPRWMIEREFVSAQGAWVNLHTAEDVLSLSTGNTGSRALGGDIHSCNKYNYIEPKAELVSDLIARNTMMIKMLSVLRVTDDTNAASLALRDFNDKLEKVLEIIKKELRNEAINAEDCLLIKDIVGRYLVSAEADKSYTLSLNGKKTTYNIKGVNYLAVIYKSDFGNAMAFGPIFKYSE